MYAISLLLTFFAEFPNAQGKGNDNRLQLVKAIKDIRVWFSFGTIGLCVIFDFGIANWLVIYLRNSQNMNPSTSASYLELYTLCSLLSEGF